MVQTPDDTMWGIVIRAAQRYARPGTDDFDEYVQAGSLGLMMARRSWRPDGGKTEASWTYMHVRNEIQKSVASKSVLKCSYPTARKHSIGVVSLDDESAPIPEACTTDDPSEQLMRKEEAGGNGLYARLWQCLNGRFTGRERDIILGYFVDGVPIRKLGRGAWAVVKRAESTIRSEMA